MTIEIPHNTSEIFRYTTDASLNFNKTEIDVIDNHRYIETDLTRKSISSFVFDLSSTLNKQSQEIEPITIFPNPTSGLIFLSGSYSEIKCSVFSISGKQLFQQTISNEKDLDLSELKKGCNLLKYNTRIVFKILSLTTLMKKQIISYSVISFIF